MSNPRVRLLSELGVGDTVETPSGKRAVVMGFTDARAQLAYLDDGQEVTLSHLHLRLVAKGGHAPLARSKLVASERGGA